METKNYPKEGLYEAELSTVLPCGECGVPNAIGEKMLIDDKTGKVYHLTHGSQPQKDDSKIYDMTVQEGLPVKSEGK